MSYRLYIAGKRYSSWSLRGWLLFEAFGLPVEERVTALWSAEFEAMRAEMAPSRTVPTLVHEIEGQRRVIWDSLAIAEYLAERHPQAGLWPTDAERRAWARSLTAEAHAGFGAMRKATPMNLGRRYENKTLSAAAQGDVDRIAELWSESLSRFGADGPYLFGADYCVADVFFTPYATRLETYGVALSGAAEAYAAALLAHPSYLKWRSDALAETARLDKYEFEDTAEVLGD